MGKIRRGGYVFEWWIGDHEPKHIHISDSSGEMLGRLTLEILSHLMIGNHRER
jgi:hypothetical protein